MDALVERIRGGDAEAFEALFHAYAVKLRGFAYSYVRSKAVAEELVQDVFFRLWQRRSEWAPGSSVAAYLYRGIRNAAIGHQRHAGVEARWEARTASQIADDDRVASNTGEAGLVGADVAVALERALAGLSADRRRVVLLRWKHGLSYAEIAQVIGSSVKAVEIQLYRTLAALRRAMREAGVG